MPKTIGMIGGLSPESTITYYEHITRGFYESTGDYPDIVIRSVDLTKYTGWFSAGDWERAGKDMAEIFEQMRLIGVDFGLICANTPHRALPYIVSGTSLPILSIIDATADSVIHAGMRNVGLLGTKFTMKEDFYKRGLADRGITAVVPEDGEIDQINRVIYEELVMGIINDESRELVKMIIGWLVDEGAKGIILGCTELPLLIGQMDCPVPIFNTTRIHAEAALKRALD
ncbi:MAG: amino acid racemase [Deltaproteobacteria bacterium]|nr:amino acid racemase [Candidatus Zymogenaceae bacterium]